MVFERHHHAALFGLGNAFLDALDAPFKTVVLGAPGQNRLDATRFHQIIEILDGVPAAGVKPDARHAQFVGDLKTLVRVLDLFLAVGGIGQHEVLVNGKADQTNAVAKGVPLELPPLKLMELPVAVPVPRLLSAATDRMPELRLMGAVKCAPLTA